MSKLSWLLLLGLVYRLLAVSVQTVMFVPVVTLRFYTGRVTGNGDGPERRGVPKAHVDCHQPRQLSVVR